MTRYGKDVIDHRTIHHIDGEFGIIGDLGIILVKVFREPHNWLFNGGQMCLGATVNEVIEKITDVETVDHIIETEGLDRFEAVMRYFSEKYSKV